MTVKVIFCVSTNQHTHIAHECTHAHTHTHRFSVYILRSKIKNAHWAEKMTTRCGIIETATTWNFVLWLFLNNCNTLACEDMPWCESRVVAIKGNDHKWKWKLGKLQWRQWGFWTESHLQPLRKEKSNHHWARRCKIWSGTTGSKNGISPTQDLQQLILGQTLWSGCLTLIENV